MSLLSIFTLPRSAWGKAYGPAVKVIKGGRTQVDVSKTVRPHRWRIPAQNEQAVRPHRWRIPVHYGQTVKLHRWLNRYTMSKQSYRTGGLCWYTVSQQSSRTGGSIGTL